VAGEIVLVLVFIGLGGFFAAAELALVSLRPGQVGRLAEKSARGRHVAHLLEHPNRFLSAVQIGVTLAGFLSSAVGAVTLAGPVRELLEGWGLSAGVAGWLSVLVVTVIVSYVSLVFGELAPKRLALQRAEGVALFSAPVLDAVVWVTRPVIWLLGRSTDLAVRLFGGDPARTREVVTEEELRDLVAANDELSTEERQLISDVLNAGDRPIREIMVPRLDVSALPVSLTVAEAIDAVESQPHSRYPVVDGGLDDVIGFVHLRDLLARGSHPNRPLRELTRPVLRLPDSRRALPALAQMRREGAHLAVVVDEYGGGAGIVTLEDLIEELVGDITDEFDPASSPVPREVDAQLRLEEFAEATGIALPQGPYDTAAGWLISRLGRIPAVGDSAQHEGVRIVVAQMRGRRVERVSLDASPLTAADQPL
jgi:putative hemolysin